MIRKTVGILLCALLMVVSTTIRADWDPGDPYKMHYPQLPNPEGWDVNATAPVVLADDWLCTETGWVKDIHFWGSWLEGFEGVIDTFVLSIHANIPGPPSEPGVTLWEWAVDFDSVVVIPIESPYWEGWYDPSTGYYVHPDHQDFFQYNVFLPEDAWFWQEQDSIYWLNISAIVSSGVWGWKSSIDHWQDDACWALWGVLDWTPMYEPPDFIETLDLAFVITGGPEEEFDFGDCPDPTYPTLLASNGARHTIVPGVFLGGSIDPEDDGQPDPNALGDDQDGNDDEDGVVFTSLVIQGQQATVKVTASIGGFLDGWIDFNADGDWADAGEQIFASQALVAGVNYLTFTVPAGAQTGTTFSRFRFSTTGGLSYTGAASDGEVEDYRVFILHPVENIKMHWPQLPDLDNTGMDIDQLWTPLADDWMCTQTGSVTDIHFWGSFAGDDLPADGPGSLTFQLTIHANIPAGVVADWSMPGDILWSRVFGPGEYQWYQIADNNPEDWYDPVTGLWINDDHLQVYQYEFYITDEPFVQLQDSIYWLEIKDITDPVDYTFGVKTTPYNLHWMDDATYWLPDPPNWFPLYYPPGHEWFPETIDLAFVITGEAAEELDFGDCPDGPYPTLLASNGARHTIVPGVFLGASIDPETDGQPDPNALGDDQDGNDDEDGVVFTSLVIQGQQATVKVTASIGGFLDGWIDFNADGDWADAGEQIFASQALVAGVNYLTFNVPAGAQVGTTFSRFRFSTSGGLSYTGPALDGEVEDYRVFILHPVENIKMHWPQLPDLDNTGMDVDQLWTPLADDWMCTQTGPVTDIHFWGSFADDILPPDGPGSLIFRVTILSNIPGPPWSMPGDTLWTRVFGPGEYQWYQVADNNPEDWYDPATGLWINDDHLQVYQYEFYITDEPFIQEQDAIYWLSIKDIIPEPGYTFGWKTTHRDLHWMDDATYWTPAIPGWFPLMYPDGHEWAGETIDLAFVITGGPVEREFIRGDATSDSTVGMPDAVYILRYKFVPGSPPPSCMKTGDANDDGAVGMPDAVYILRYKFIPGSPPPPTPFPNCGTDPTPDTLDCQSYPPCEGTFKRSSPKESGGKLYFGEATTTDNKLIVPVYLENIIDLSAFAYELNYDPSLVSNVSLENMGLVTEGFDFFSARAEDGKAAIGALVSLTLSRNLRPGSYKVADMVFELSREIDRELILNPVQVELIDTEGKVLGAQTEGSVVRISTPLRLTLGQNYPNPLTDHTSISYGIPKTGRVGLKVYSLNGQLIKTLVSAEQKPGYYTVHWNGEDATGERVATGVYFYRLTMGNQTLTRKLLVMR